MEFSVLELTENSKNYFEISSDKNSLIGLKETNEQIYLKIKFDTLNLGQKLFGANKRETILIQKKNCSVLLKFYRVLKRAVKILVKKNVPAINLYIEKLSEKKNNNDLMLLGLLNIDFNAKLFGRLKMGYEYACDFLDAENSLNKICDFQNNRCTKHREKGIEKSTGCCPNFCKIRVEGQPCSHKNLSCKIFMCDYIIDTKGYYFTPNTLAVLKKTMSPLERLVCFSSLCRTEKKSLSFLKTIRIMKIIIFALLIFAVYALING